MNIINLGGIIARCVYKFFNSAEYYKKMLPHTFEYWNMESGIP